MKKVEYSQIVKRKLKALKERLVSEFGPEVSKKALNFMYKLFGISTTSQESLDYWNE